MLAASRVTIASFVVLLVRSAVADHVTLPASRDNTLYGSDKGSVSNGQGGCLFAGRSAQASDPLFRRRALLAFDVAAAIPAGSTVNAVTLTLNVTNAPPPNPPTPASPGFALHRVLADWGEGTSSTGVDCNPDPGGTGAPAASGDATWLHAFYPVSTWTSPGGDFAGAPSATLGVGQVGPYTWGSTPALVADVQAWLDDPVSNFGWLLHGDEFWTMTARRFDSREAAGGAAQPPLLSVTFTPPGESSGACCGPDGSCQVLTAADCKNQGGTYQGGSDCDHDPCPQPIGACCHPNQKCRQLTPGACADQGGTYMGAGTRCDDVSCPEAMGACCQAGSACQQVTAAACAAGGGKYQGDGTGCDPHPCLEPFVDALPIPPVARPVLGAPGATATYEIAMTEFTHELHRDLPPTTLWGYAGMYPGPTIEAGRGQPVTVTWVNDLRDVQGKLRTEHYLPVDHCMHGAHTSAPRTVIHFHGGNVPAQVDGNPEYTFLPGESVVYEYPNQQLPATLWYHDHALGITRLNVYMGLAGFYLLRDPFELDLDLPAGEFEVPLLIQDRAFRPNGSLAYPATWDDEFFGNTVLVNGKAWPYLEVKRGKYRFRIVNGSNMRTYALSLAGGDAFHQIGTDGGLMSAPVELHEVILSPAERADVVFDFARYPSGTEIILTNSAPAPFPGTPGVGVISNVMKFIVTDLSGDTDPLPGTLRPLERLQESDAARVREFTLRQTDDLCNELHRRWLIGGLGWEQITDFPQLGTTEVWSFVNRSDMVHPMHIHLVMFQVLDRQMFQVVSGDQIIALADPVGPDPNEVGWKDTVRAPPFHITRVIMQFNSYAGLYPFHCHKLEHEDNEMMRQFRVVCPGDGDVDGAIDHSDLEGLLAAWGLPDDRYDLAPDGGDGIVSVVDLLALLSRWGSCP